MTFLYLRYIHQDECTIFVVVNVNHNIYAGSIRLYSIYFLLFYFFSAMSMQVASVFKVYRFCCCYFYKCNINAGSIRFQGIVLNSYPPRGGGEINLDFWAQTSRWDFQNLKYSVFLKPYPFLYFCVYQETGRTPPPPWVSYQHLYI